MTRDGFIRAGGETGFQDFDSVELASPNRADIAPKQGLIDDSEQFIGGADPVAPGPDAQLTDGGREPIRGGSDGRAP